MANYKENSVTGTSWRRCGSIQIFNPHVSVGQPPRATFWEEEIIDMGDGKFFISPSNPMVPQISVVIDPVKTIDLYDPITGLKLEGQTMTHAQLYAILYSAYRTEAEKRDSMVATPLAPINP